VRNPPSQKINIINFFLEAVWLGQSFKIPLEILFTGAALYALSKVLLISNKL